MLDRFGAVARDYARYRPTYPSALFEMLAGLAPGRRAAWDCATGSGQAAVGLAQRFALVVGSDASRKQLSEAVVHPRVRYLLARAEAVPLSSHTIDVVTVAQALHWLDPTRFWPEVRRVLVPGGLIAAWCYNLCLITPEIDAALRRFYFDVVGPYWTPERRWVEDGYRTVPFPFSEVDVMSPEMHGLMTLDGLVGYAGTWSATERYRLARGEDPTSAFREELLSVWPNPTEVRPVRWPLSVRVGRT